MQCPVCKMEVEDSQMEEHKKMHMEKEGMGDDHAEGHSKDDGHNHDNM